MEHRRPTDPSFPAAELADRLRRTQAELVNFSREHGGHHVDETRMFAIEQMPPEALAASRAVIEIHPAVLGRGSPGGPWVSSTGIR